MTAHLSTPTELHDLIRERWSPRAFSGTPISADNLNSLLTAAQWAPSSMNEQPWRFIVGDRYDAPEAHARILSTLIPQNAVWAVRAPVLIAVVAKSTFTRNGAVNVTASYDTGAAVAHLTFQATSLGLAIHQMGGFSRDQARTLLGIPEGFEPVAVLAVGYPGDPGELSDELRAREVAPRRRNPLDQAAYRGVWGEAWT